MIDLAKHARQLNVLRFNIVPKLPTISAWSRLRVILTWEQRGRTYFCAQLVLVQLLDLDIDDAAFGIGPQCRLVQSKAAVSQVTGGAGAGVGRGGQLAPRVVKLAEEGRLGVV